MATVTHGATLAISPRVEERLRRGELTSRQVEAFQDFLHEVDHDLLHHRIVIDNAYTRWFQEGAATDEELRHFVRQFSVFSNQFLVAALLRVINAPTLQQARSAKEILMNELGVIYRRTSPGDGPLHAPSSALTVEAKDREGDPELVSTEGTVDGGTFRFRAAHFEWLLAVAEGLGLDFTQIGQRRHGRPSTLHFCDELRRLYGSEDSRIAEGASFAVENWAAAGFWQELEDGLLKIKQERHPQLRIAFFTWHNRVEAQHAGHTMEELEGVYFAPGFDRDKFFQGGHEVLEAIAAFWDGLEQDRLSGESS
jgi:pyrroloquinoline quinone (PQQ) biosynthesis protein C